MCTQQQGHVSIVKCITNGRGYIVGMTACGVNHAPALRKAYAGVALSGATD